MATGVDMANLTAHRNLHRAVELLHYGLPVTVLLYYLVAASISVCTLQTISEKIRDQKAPRKLILWFKLGVLVTYVRPSHHRMSSKANTRHRFVKHPCL